jgi:hypothetical protein
VPQEITDRFLDLSVAVSSVPGGGAHLLAIALHFRRVEVEAVRLLRRRGRLKLQGAAIP